MERVKAWAVRWARPLLNWEVAAYVFLAVVALGMHLWALDARAFQYDETLHAFYSWKLYTGESYQHSPMMHGPFQFYGTAALFHLFGDSDVTARLLPALFGTVLVALPYLLRRQMGRWGAMAAAVLLAFSPTLLYFGRFARNDIYIVFWTLLLVVCLWRYIDEGKSRYLYIGAAALSLSFCTKEVSWITTGIIGLFLLIWAGRELVGRVRRRVDLKALSPPADYLIVVGTLSLPLFAAFCQLIPGVDIDGGAVWQKALVVGILFAVSLAVGLRWDWRRWSIAAIIFYGIFCLFYSSFFSNVDGLASGIWGSVDYWLANRDAPRIVQPLFYYPMVLATYEFLPLLFGLVGGVYYAIKGDAFSRFLVYWAAMALILQVWSGENTAWLSVHIALPLILLAAMFIGRALAGGWPGRWARVVPAAVVLALVVVFPFSVHVALQASYNVSDEPPQMLVYAGMSHEMRQVVDQIEGLAADSGKGTGLRISVDNPLYWDWAWYIRDYDVQWLYATDLVPDGDVLLLAPENEAAFEPHLGGYGEGQHFHERIWFPEEYRDHGIGWWWRYFLSKETEGPYWSSESIVYVAQGVP